MGIYGVLSGHFLHSVVKNWFSSLLWEYFGEIVGISWGHFGYTGDTMDIEVTLDNTLHTVWTLWPYWTPSVNTHLYFGVSVGILFEHCEQLLANVEHIGQCKLPNMPKIPRWRCAQTQWLQAPLRCFSFFIFSVYTSVY